MLEPINGLIKKFPNTHQFCNEDINKLVLLLRKSVYPYEYMNSWERLDETSLPDKKLFTANCIQKTLMMKIIRVLKKYLKN